MKPLILAGEHGVKLFKSDLADITVPFSFRFVSGLPSSDELNGYVARRSDRLGPGSHWSDFAGRWRKAHADRKDLGLFEFCQSYKTVELWFDRRPNDQLQLIWMLDLLRSAPEIAGSLRLRFVDYDLLGTSPEELSRWDVPFIEPTSKEFETASLVWQAYRAASPAPFVQLLASDLSALLLLRPALLHLVEELPSLTTGLGATEMRLLELIARGYERSNALFHLLSFGQRRIFNEFSCVDSRTVPRRRSQALTTSCASSARKIIAAARRPTCEAGCRSPSLARRLSRTRKTSAVTIRLIVGGEART